MAEVTILGTLQGGRAFQGMAHFCVFEIATGSGGWSLISGDKSGQTQLAEVDEGHFACWSHPVAVQFGASTLEDWPAAVVQVWAQDELRRNAIVGYGTARIPMKPGLHSIDIPTWIPEDASSTWSRLGHWLLGAPTVLDDTSVAGAAGGARSELVARSSGTVSLEVTVVVKSLAERGVYTGVAAERMPPPRLAGKRSQQDLQSSMAQTVRSSVADVVQAARRAAGKPPMPRRTRRPGELPPLRPQAEDAVSAQVPSDTAGSDVR